MTVLLLSTLLVRRATTVGRGERYVDPAVLSSLVPGAPVHARAGERWTFTIRSMHGGPTGTETWDVVDVGPAGVRCRVRPISGAERLETWALSLRVRSERVLHASRGVLTVGGRMVDCDVVEVVDASSGGLDNVRVWIAMDRNADAPTFPGVVRAERIESRGRTLVEWEVASVAVLTSGQ